MNLSFDLSPKKILGIAIALLAVLLICTYRMSTSPSGAALSGVILACVALAVLALVVKIDVVVEVLRDELEPKKGGGSGSVNTIEPYRQRSRREDLEQSLVHALAPGLHNRMEGTGVGAFIRAAADAILGGGLPAAKAVCTCGPNEGCSNCPSSGAKADQRAEAEIVAAGLTAPRVTPADIELEISSEWYFTANDGVLGAYRSNNDVYQCVRHDDGYAEGPLSLVTFCVLILKNGTKVVGINYGAIDPKQHSAETGRKEARAQAVEKVWELLGFRLRDELARPTLTHADSEADLAGLPRPDHPAT